MILITHVWRYWGCFPRNDVLRMPLSAWPSTVSVDIPMRDGHYPNPNILTITGIIITGINTPTSTRAQASAWPLNIFNMKDTMGDFSTSIQPKCWFWKVFEPPTRYNQILTIKHGLLENPASMDDFPRNISWSFVAHSFFPGPCSLARLQCPRESFGKWLKSDQDKWLEKSGKIDPIKMLNYLSLRLQKILLNDGH